LDALEAWALQVTFDVAGVPATVTLSGGQPIVTAAIWLEPILIDAPISNDLQRRDVRRVVALRKADVPTAPRGTRIDGAERVGGPVLSWRVDESEAADPVHMRVIVVPWS
jgi:hypothetical protein